MVPTPVRRRSWLLVVGFGALLLVAGVWNFVAEITTHSRTAGHVAAFLLDGVPALVLIYAGYWLSRSDFDPDARLRISGWSLTGGAVFGGTIGATIVVRLFENRPIGEPAFPLLVALGVGSLAGFAAGYYNARTRAETEQAQSMRDAFAFVNDLIRHDLRNDLTVISGYADLIEDEDSDIISEKAEEALTRIEVSRAISETLVEGDTSGSIDLAGVTAEVAERIDDTYDVTVTTDLPEQARVTANPGIRSVVDNLLENAAEHNTAEDPRAHVTIDRDDETVRLAVRDNGAGVPEDRQEGLFEARTSASRGGLALAKALTDRYGGHIRYEGGDAGGSNFVVELPRADAVTTA
ncbi:ATP-binding protein [Natronomonas amylolytica]|uniref:ATP-binding protein n=1 Tax=Natronomonas amylolytica TaxID=3108498 RepID=UPI00300AD59C